jgi:Domain of unknown function (DUF4383)
MADRTNDTRTEKGISLARGPALVLGVLLLAAGLYFVIRAHYFPRLSGFPNGRAPQDTKVFGIFGANGWTGMLTAIAGGLLLFGAAQHLLAKAMSLIVGVALAAAAIIALVHGNVLGLAAANSWTELGWGAVAAILLFNTLAPRRGGATVAGAGSRPTAVSTPRSRPAPAPVAEREVVPARSGSAGDNQPTTVMRHDQRTAQDRAPGTAPTEVVDRGTSQTEVVDRGTAQTEVVDRGTAQTEVVDRGTSQTEVVDRETAQTASEDDRPI